MAELDERIRAEWERQSVWLPGVTKFEPLVERKDGNVMRFSTKLANDHEFSTTALISSIERCHSGEGGPKKIVSLVINGLLDRIFTQRFMAEQKPRAPHGHQNEPQS
jgi:hypothetical protein